MHSTFVSVLYLSVLIYSIAYRSDGNSADSCTNNSLVMTPDVDIYLRVGRSIYVYCGIENGKSSDELYFSKSLKNPEQLSYEKFDNQTIRFLIQESQTQKFKLYCRSNEVFCTRNVYIGYPPLQVEKFHCISFNWNILQCAYNLKRNFAQRKRDNYHLCYYTNNTEECVQGFKCPKNDIRCCKLRGDECWTWGISKDYPYLSTDKEFYFNLSSENVLGSRIFTHFIDHYSIVLPDSVKKLKGIPISPYEIDLSWKLPIFMSTFPPGLIYRIQYEVFGEKYTLMGYTVGQAILSKTIILPWPGQTYSISVTLRSGENSTNHIPQSGSLWSDPSTISVTPPSTLPLRPPTSTPGMFQMTGTDEASSTRDLIIFWKPISKKETGGPGIEYSVEAYQNRKQFIHGGPSYVSSSFAVFKNLSSHLNYEFHIKGTNKVGSSETLVVSVPGKEEFPYPLIFPELFYEIDSIYLRWFTDNYDLYPLIYTVFWCTDGSPYLYDPCREHLNWKIVGNESNIRLQISELGLNGISVNDLRFAVSAVRQDSSASSGIIWSTCPLSNYSSEYKMSESAPVLEISRRNAHIVSVKWSLSCNNWMKKITVLQLLWCEGRNNKAEKCAKTVSTKNLTHWQSEAEMDNLRPSSNYTAWLRIVYESGTEEISKEVYVTMEAMTLSLEIISVIGVSAAIGVLVVFWTMCRTSKWVKKFRADWNTGIALPEGLQNPKEMATHGFTSKKTLQKRGTDHEIKDELNYLSALNVQNNPTSNDHLPVEDPPLGNAKAVVPPLETDQKVSPMLTDSKTLENNIEPSTVELGPPERNISFLNEAPHTRPEPGYIVYTPDEFHFRLSSDKTNVPEQEYKSENGYVPAIKLGYPEEKMPLFNEKTNVSKPSHRGLEPGYIAYTAIDNHLKLFFNRTSVPKQQYESHKGYFPANLFKKNKNDLIVKEKIESNSPISELFSSIESNMNASDNYDNIL